MIDGKKFFDQPVKTNKITYVVYQIMLTLKNIIK